MSLGKDRSRINVKGLGNLEIREREPVDAADFDDVGRLQGTDFADESTVVEVVDEQGNLVDALESERKGSIKSALLQSSIEEWNIMRNSLGKYYAARYFGLSRPEIFHYICIEEAKIIPTITKSFKPGLQPLPLEIKMLAQTELSYDVPLYHFAETKGLIKTKKLRLWLTPRHGVGVGTAKLMDVSGYARHGDITADFASIFIADTNPAYILRFDGTNDDVSLGDTLDVLATDDFAIELWLRVKGADATQQEVLSKKSADADEAGFRIIRTSANKIEAKLSDGVDSASIITAASVLQNVWKHVMLIANRAGNAQLYLNGVADGAAVDITSVGDMSNTVAFYLARLAAAYGQVDIGDVRFYNWGATGIPSNAATFPALHFAAEKGYYGL